jgi:hypothetical protein
LSLVDVELLDVDELSFDDDEEDDELEPPSLLAPEEPESLDELSFSLEDDSFDDSFEEDEPAGAPLAEELDERESVMYQPLPLNTMPTGWMTLRSVPPHCSHVVRGGSEKLWRFSICSLQAVQV